MGFRVHARGVETRNAALADHASPLIKALDRDVVRPGRPVDSGSRPPLRELQKPRLHDELAHCYGHVLEGTRARGSLTARKHAKFAAADLAHDAPTALVVDRELAIAEKREIVLEKPLQKRATLGALCCVDRGPGGAHIFNERFNP